MKTLTKDEIRATIARRAARELHDGDVVNLGIGIPTNVCDYLPDNVHVVLQSENGIFGMGPRAAKGEEHPELTDAGCTHVTLKPGAALFDSADSFAYIRGGHIDITILGALQVDAEGNIANWSIPGAKTPGMGGAMDLVSGTPNVIVAMEHTAAGKPKILDRCTFPLTAAKVVKKIITEMGVFEVRPEGLVMTEYNPDFTVEDVLGATEAKVTVSPDLKPMNA